MRSKRLIRDASRLPHRYAVMLSLCYFAIACLWIEYSGDWAKVLAQGSVDALNDIERYKGFLFVFSTSTLMYIFCHVIFSRITQNAKDLLKSEERRIEAEREALPALLAASVAHDVANLLTVLRLSVERLKQVSTSPNDVLDCVSRLDRSTDRLTDVVQRLREASRSLFRDPPRSFSFSDTVNDTIELMRTHTAVCANEIEFAESESLSLSGYPVLIHQLVMNLILNAAEAIGGGGGEGSGAGGGGGKIRFRATPMQDGVCLIAEDNGPGIPLNNRQKILGAFFTTKASGTGLGLLSVRSCVDIHDGSLKIGDSELGGAKFIIELPNLTTDRIRQLRSPEQTARIQAPVFEALEH